MKRLAKMEANCSAARNKAFDGTSTLRGTWGLKFPDATTFQCVREGINMTSVVKRPEVPGDLKGSL